MPTLTYKGYEGTVDIDLERMVCRGKVLFVRDLVTFETTNVAEIQTEFEAAVDDYLETCKELGREPERAFSGLLQVRMPPALHREVSLCSVKLGITINAVIVKAIEENIAQKTSVNNINVVINSSGTEEMTTWSGTKMMELMYGKPN